MRSYFPLSALFVHPALRFAVRLRQRQARVQAQLAEKKAAKAAEVAAQRASAEHRIQVREKPSLRPFSQVACIHKVCFGQVLPVKLDKFWVRDPHAVRLIPQYAVVNARTRNGESKLDTLSHERWVQYERLDCVFLMPAFNYWLRCSLSLLYRAGGDGEEQEDPTRQEDCLRLEGCRGKKRRITTIGFRSGSEASIPIELECIHVCFSRTPLKPAVRVGTRQATSAFLSVATKRH